MPSRDEDLMALLRRLQAGDDSALEGVIEHTRGLGQAVAVSVMRDPTTAKDVLQDAYWTVYRNVGRLRDLQAFTAWFTTVVRRRALREVKRFQPMSLDDMPASDSVEVPAEAGLSTEDRMDLERALQNLPERDRTILTLREGLDYSYEDIAATLKLPLGTVKSRLSEARRKLLLVMTSETPPSEWRGRGRPRKALALLALIAFTGPWHGFHEVLYEV